MLRVIFIGCVDMSYQLLEVVNAHPQAELAGLITLRDSSVNSDFKDLTPLAGEVPIHFADDAGSEEQIGFINEIQADVIFCFGWSRLLPVELFAIPPMGAIGFHPAPLPRGRGRHPLIWALVLGLEATASSFFQMTEAADSGDILSQSPITLSMQDNAASLYNKVANTATQQLHSLISQLDTGTTKPVVQVESEASSWRKRSRVDGLIHWNMSSLAIYNLIRALSRPYPGAECQYQGVPYAVWRAEISDCPVPVDCEPGKVIAAETAGILVKTYDGSILLTEHDLPGSICAGEYLN